jgi:hypothetical protein
MSPSRQEGSLVRFPARVGAWRAVPRSTPGTPRDSQAPRVDSYWYVIAPGPPRPRCRRAPDAVVLAPCALGPSIRTRSSIAARPPPRLFAIRAQRGDADDGRRGRSQVSLVQDRGQPRSSLFRVRLLSYLPILCIRVHTCLHVVGHERADKQSGDGGWARSSDGTVIKDRRDGRAIQRSFETGSITEVLRRRTVVDVLRRAVGTPSQLERGESSVSLGATVARFTLTFSCPGP